MKRFLSVILSMLLLLGCLCSTVSCNKKNDKEHKKNDKEQVDTKFNTSTAEDDLGEFSKLSNYDFEGREITILAREQFAYEIAPDESAGDSMDQLIYRRNGMVEEKYNVNLSVELLPGAYVNRNEYKERILAVVESAGACDYDIISGAQNQFCVYVTEGLFANLHANQGIDFDNPWWFDGYVDNMTLNNKLYLTVGDVGVTLLENMNVFAFNKTLFSQNGIEYPYELVRNDQWTLENLNEITKNYACIDLNRNDLTDSEDSFVLCGGGASLRSVPTSFDIKITSPDDMGLPEITMYNDRTLEIMEDFQSMLVRNSRAYFKDVDDDGSEASPVKIFSENRSLLISTLMYDVKTIRNSEVEFGIVPFPKYNTAQENYYTHVYETLSVYAIPVNAGSQYESGLILEAMGAASYDYVTEEYFENVISLRNSHDSDSMEMLAIARKNISFNFGAVHSAALGDIGAVFDNMKLGNYNLSNRWDTSEESWNIALGRLLDKYLAMDETK